MVALARCTVNFESAEVNKSSCVTIHLNGIPACEKPQLVAIKLNSPVGSLVHTRGTQKNESTYEVAYTPQMRGRHQLGVTLNGDQVAGSPYTMCVKIPPTQLGTPVRVISGLNLPYGIAFNSAEEVLITMPGQMQIFNKRGKLLRTIKCTFRYPQGVAVDKEDNVFLADSGRHCVYKLDKHDNQLKVIGRRGSGNSEFRDPRGVAVIGEQVFVCDADNHRIQVFNRELEFVKVIGSCGTEKGQFNRVCDVSPDEVQNLYVCDRNNHRIQVLNSKGEFLYAFGTKGKSIGQLDGPAGVCVSDQYVYVSEFGNDRVSVFYRDGRFVTSFGTGGSPEGCFRGPVVLRIDKDNFVYVCDCINDRIQIF